MSSAATTAALSIPSVLETTDGSAFKTVASLPVPVRYPAVAVAGNAIYLFGGETASGRPTDAVQAINPAAGTARVVAHLPQPASHASAVDLGGRIYVLGGTAGGSPTDRIVAFDPGTRALHRGGHASVARVERRRGRRRRLGVSDRGPRQGRSPARLRGPAHAEDRPRARAAPRHVHQFDGDHLNEHDATPPRQPRTDGPPSAAAC